ncbi:hypothetical protein FPQ18DRAFT_351142 [Pyronema domesticum]|nr:hypothetical protein FPQ18DRAFT_351142 [Pyronema domesticum]
MPMDYRASPSAQPPYGNSIPGPSNAGGFGSSRRADQGAQAAAQFDLFEWYGYYRRCLNFFVEESQHKYPCQALAAFINIRLPCQRGPNPTPPALPSVVNPHAGAQTYSGINHGSSSSTVVSYPHPIDPSQGPPGHNPPPSQNGWVSLHPYIRRLVATGFDQPAILEGWFGKDWRQGVGTLHEQERRNFLFAAKSGGWSAVKTLYDGVSDDSIPYLKPLTMVDDVEIKGAEETWSQWLAMEDWMLGNRAPEDAMGR